MKKDQINESDENLKLRSGKSNSDVTNNPQSRNLKRDTSSDREAEKKQLIAKANESDESRFLDENLDKANEKATLVGNPQLQPYIVNAQKYEPRVPLIFYDHIYRLNGWDRSGDKLLKRPGIVGKWMNDLVYLRYPVGTLKELQDRNPMIDGVRLFKHHQFLSLLGIELFKEFIRDANDEMSKCKNWTQFIRRFAKKHGKPYQLDLFEDLDK